MGLTLIMSCSKEPIDQTQTTGGEVETEVISCDLSLEINQEIDTLGTVLTAVASNGTEPYSFLWSTGETEEMILVSQNGNYGVTVTDAEGCTFSLAVDVEISAGLCDDFFVSITSDSIIYELTAYVTGGTVPYTYNWSNNQTSSIIMINEDGEYSVTVTDSEGCIATTSITVGNTDCSGFFGELFYDESSGIVSPIVEGGVAPFTYEWSNGQTTNTIAPTDNGLYTIIVTDSQGCSFFASINLVLNDVCSVFISQDTTTNDIIAFPSGGVEPYVYLWSTGETTEEIEISVDGEYGVTITDANGCTASAIGFFIIWESCNDLTIEFDYDEIANTLTGVASGGVNPFTYLWNTGDTTETININAPGVYSLQITDANGCVAMGLYTIE